MVISVSSYDEVDEFMYPLGGGNYNSRFPDGDYFDKLSWLAKTNRFSYLSQQVGGGLCDSRRNRVPAFGSRSDARHVVVMLNQYKFGIA